MLVLRSVPASPFGRKVTMGASVAGLSDQIEVAAADTTNETDSLRSQNPLGKIPTLVLPNGTAVYDSAVIVEYLDQLAGKGSLIPVETVERFRSLTGQALADGICEAALLVVYESRYRDEAIRSLWWVDYQKGKIARALQTFEGRPPTGRIAVDHLALAAALGYLDLRFAGEWRATHPGLVSWLDDFSAKVPAFEATRAPPPPS